MDIRGIGGESARLRDRLGGPERGAAELDDALRHGVDMAVDLCPETVDHLVQGNELRAFDVPMCLLCEQGEVDTVGEACVQQLDRNLLRVGIQIILRAVHRPASSWFWKNSARAR